MDINKSGLKTVVENENFLVWYRVSIWRTGRHTTTKNSWEYPPAGNLHLNLIFVF